MTISLKIKKRSMEVIDNINEQTITETIQSEIATPVPVFDIIDVEVAIIDLEAEASEDAVIVKGVLNKIIYYVDEENNLLTGTEDIKIEKRVAMAGVISQMHPTIKARVLNLENKVLQEKNIEITAHIEINIKVKAKKEIEIMTEVEGLPEDVILKKIKMHLENVIGEELFREEVSHNITLPQNTSNIIRNINTLKNVKAQVYKDAVLIEGSLIKQIFYADMDNTINDHTEVISLSKEIKFPGSNTGDEVYVEVNTFNKLLQAHEVPSDKFEQKLIIDYLVKVFKSNQIDIIVDVSGPGVKAEKMTLEMENIVTDTELEENFNSKLELPLQVNRVLHVTSSLSDVEARISDGQIFISGKMQNVFFLLDQDNFFRVHREIMPVAINGPVMGGDSRNKITVTPKAIEEVMFNLTGPQDIELDVTAGVIVRITEELKADVVSNLKIMEAPPDVKTNLYIVQRNDTLVKISHRFKVDLQDIISVNPEIDNPDVIYPGQKIRIPV